MNTKLFTKNLGILRTLEVPFLSHIFDRLPHIFVLELHLKSHFLQGICITRSSDSGLFVGSIASFLLSSYFDDEVHKAMVIITGHWGVRPNDQLTVYTCRQVDVLSYNKMSLFVYG